MPPPPSRALFICAHSAGGHQDDPAMLATAAALGARGIDVVRFNFPYRSRGSRLPDRMPQLKAAFDAVVEPLLDDGRKLLIGRHSMGGPPATILVADRLDCDGLLLVGSQVHPVGQAAEL